ncbi:hypothetical protein BsWGS_10159 [Bradybaena similaris]
MRNKSTSNTSSDESATHDTPPTQQSNKTYCTISFVDCKHNLLAANTSSMHSEIFLQQTQQVCIRRYSCSKYTKYAFGDILAANTTSMHSEISSSKPVCNFKRTVCLKYVIRLFIEK